MAATRGNGDFAIHSGGNQPIWFSLTGSWTDNDTEELSYGLAVIGTHRNVAPNSIVGMMLQFDVAEQSENSGAEISGTGWLVGPYFATQITEQPLFLERRLLYGQTNNEISPFGTYTDAFLGERWLVTLGAEGRYQTEDDWIISPNLTLSHVQETQKSYTNSLSNLVPEQSIQLTEISIGVDFEVPVPLDQGELWLDWGISGIYSKTTGDGAATAYVPNEEGGRARIDFGLRYDNDVNLTFFGGGFVDGLGSESNLRIYGVEFGLEFTL